jgi:hypothetical protein
MGRTQMPLIPRAEQGCQTSSMCSLAAAAQPFWERVSLRWGAGRAHQPLVNVSTQAARCQCQFVSIAA